MFGVPRTFANSPESISYIDSNVCSCWKYVEIDYSLLSCLTFGLRRKVGISYRRRACLSYRWRSVGIDGAGRRIRFESPCAREGRFLSYKKVA